MIGLDSTPRDPNLIRAWLLAPRFHNTNQSLTFASVELSVSHDIASIELLFQILTDLYSYIDGKLPVFTKLLYLGIYLKLSI